MNLAQLEERSRKFASVVTSIFHLKQGDVIALLASDSVNRSNGSNV